MNKMDSIEKILNLNIEIEGLLRTMIARPNNEAKSLLYTKFDEYAALFYESFPPIMEEDIEDVEETKDTEEVDLPAYTLEEDLHVYQIKKEPTEETAKEEVPAEKETPAEKAEEKPAPIPAFPEVEAIGDILVNDKPRLDEIISRNEAKNLSKAFTINDKFRFIRELFNNNQQLFNTSLQAVSEMKRFDEAFTYFVEIHGMDPEEPTTKDFLEIIAKHFGG